MKALRKIASDTKLTMTQAQLDSLIRVVLRQSPNEPLSVHVGEIGLPDIICVQYPYIFIGIETDGYAHS